jgi:signal recognition particle subunit SRP54
MFDTLGNKLQDSFRKLSGQKKISEENIDNTISEIRRILLESDVSLKAVKLFTNRVKKKALGEEVLRGIKPSEQFIKIVNDALIELLGGGSENAGNLNLNPENLNSILLLGLQGSGKTTAAAKLAYKYKSEGYRPLLIPCDLQRPAAIKQLKILAEEAQVEFLDISIEEKDPEANVKKLREIAEKAKALAKEKNLNLLIFDSAGRLQIDTDLMAELFLLEKSVQADEKLLVLDSLIGQEAANVAEAFSTQIGITGVILTKLDGDSRGGAALSVAEACGKAIKLASVGEKLEDLENFYPERMASRILGQGDVISLVEKAEAKIEEEEARKLEDELKKGNFNFETFISAQNMMSKIGSFSSILKMMGMGSFLREMGLDAKSQDELLETSQEKMSRYKTVISSMTKQERLSPDLLSGDHTSKSRRARLAKGSGRSETEIAQLCAEFQKMKKLFKNLGPMLGMMGSGDSKESNSSINPMDMLGNMMGGMSRKQLKAVKQRGGIPISMPKAQGQSHKIKKGSKPSIKSFKV